MEGEERGVRKNECANLGESVSVCVFTGVC